MPAGGRVLSREAAARKTPVGGTPVTQSCARGARTSQGPWAALQRPPHKGGKTRKAEQRGSPRPGLHGWWADPAPAVHTRLPGGSGPAGGAAGSPAPRASASGCGRCPVAPGSVGSPPAVGDFNSDPPSLPSAQFSHRLSILGVTTKWHLCSKALTLRRPTSVVSS